MDAISFVLGEKTQNLRVRNLRVSHFPGVEICVCTCYSVWSRT